MNDHNDNDRVAVNRYVDAEMSAPQRTAFEARLRAEPALAELLAEAEALRAVFAVARAEPAPMRRAGMSARVLARLQAGAPEEGRGDLERQIQRVARACVLAAAAVLLVATLFAAGILRLPDSGQLQADSGSELIRALDAKIQAADVQRRAVRR